MRTFFVMLGICSITLVTTAVAEQARLPKTAQNPDDIPPVKIDQSGGRYQLVGTIKDIMEGMVDPNADLLWDAVATDITTAGIIEKRPSTDAEWAVLEHAALTLAEAPNLLKMPGRKVARPGQTTQSEGPDAPELSPEQILAKINANPTLFMRHANGLQNAAKKALAATRKKDADALFEVGEEIDTACENCHLEYWYPKDKKPLQPRTLRKK